MAKKAAEKKVAEKKAVEKKVTIISCAACAINNLEPYTTRNKIAK